MKKLELIIERQDGHFWGSVSAGPDEFMPTGQGETIEELIKNVKECIEDYVAHEGKRDVHWNKVNLEAVEFDIKYDLHAFFEKFNFLSVKYMADQLDINRTLLNHYKTGARYPSLKQAKKIESGIHKIADQLSKVELVGTI